MTKWEAKPEGVKWTDDQWRAIVADGQDILVAAAAGSGKTAVLVERIIKKVIHPAHPIDVDSLLVVTFTNASAAEMRHRIGEALEKALSQDVHSTHLRKQLSLLNRASISTLHSFCLNVIRNYYYLLDIDPGFRIGNETEVQLLIEEVLEELLEEEYGLEDNELFFELVDRYTGDRDDQELQTMVLKLYTDSRAHPVPTKWLEHLVNLYDVQGKEVEDTVYGKMLQDNVMLKLHGLSEQLEQGLEVTKQPAGPAPYAITLEEDKKILDLLIDQSRFGWQALYEAMQTVKFTTIKRVKAADYDADLIEQVKKIRQKIKDGINDIKDELFNRAPDRFLKDMEDMYPLVQKLVHLVHEFAGRFAKKKLEKGIVDFNDLEHLCLAILRDQSSDEEIIPSSVALEYREKFTEVLVDEYQDTNFVQESILRLVTKDGEASGNLFMVGDVKQSIYRFRLAEPGLFLGKYKRFTKDGEESGLRIDLSQNFRSRAEVLDATNFIFKQIMGERVGEIMYDNDAELKLGANYPESDRTAAEFIVINKNGGEEESNEGEFDFGDLETSQLEARLIASKIKEMVANEYEVFDRDRNVMRKVMYRDFVILLRSMPWAPQMMEEFKIQGIPVYAELAKGYFEAIEVAIMLNLLRIVDNPLQDIEFVSVLRSPIVSVTDEELALLRIEQKQGSFYEVVKNYMAGGKDTALKEKLAHFYHQLQAWRDVARNSALSDLIWKIYRDTGYFDFVGGMPGGKQRQANLRVLYDRARQYEATSFRGLFRFLHFIERMRERGEDLGTARTLGEQEDVVRIMTIHKSKGLEFPVVFVAGLGKQFNRRDIMSKFMLHKELGFGSKYMNPRLRIAYPSLPQLAIKEKMKTELIAEEMRVLYVALTRAKEKLILLGTVKDKEKALKQWSETANQPGWLLPDYNRSTASSYIDWVGPALLRHRDAIGFELEESPHVQEDVYTYPCKWKMYSVDERDLHLVEEEKIEQNKEFLTLIEQGKPVPAEHEWKDEVVSRLTWEYEYEDAVKRRAKQSVSEIKRSHQMFTEEVENVYEQRSRMPISKRPRFMEKKGLTAAEHGTAMHMVMQQLHIQDDISLEGIEEQVARMVNQEFLTEEQAESIHIDKIVAFFETEIGEKMRQVDNIEREVPFNLVLSAKEAYPDWEHEEDETILVQGIIDCLVEEEDGFILLDYKSDNITDRFAGDFTMAKDVLQERYELQVRLYSLAIERIFHKPVKEKYLYFFDGAHVLAL
ncbi:helicase-exonuclease AddAB subunit AddA [Priestia taiwanensis]|uniref:ATP-dependent helicase/nuclease subunit A n=1 Tax=Priestia taiwanensis TaxID=1347902 RepID=A0A917ATU5_9BACI|nr:helicase-exonuclease AddAB subunit AddA [Priestia taiwanensis]MBM7364220.1 ATP-dependent helicase/nuclease subunit A [Priestia taiwanensis]GGE72636.1 ATP-dependent helicase/nuclease subunit A [Priestia taiwanensis]